MNETIQKDSSDTSWAFDNSYARLPERFFEKTAPLPVKSPSIVTLNKSLALELGLDEAELLSEKGLALFSGNNLPANAEPIALAYSGHQFGHFVPVLGDGRAHLVGEHINLKGDRFDIQLKGSGRTSFSRRGDGRATLSAVMREYIIGEALHGLNIPATRTLAVVATGEEILREGLVPGGIQTRVAKSHIRVGTFEYFSFRNDLEGVKMLADYLISRHYSQGALEENPYIYLLNEVVKNQARLIAKWVCVGFIHGVMNTDNMLLSGESVDFGPCAFINAYDPNAVFSSIDAHGRYALAAQPHIAKWNLARFAESILFLLHPQQERAFKIAQKALGLYSNSFQEEWLSLMGKKLGLTNTSADDLGLIKELLQILHDQQLDYTNTFYGLCVEDQEKTPAFIQLPLKDNRPLKEWHERWLLRTQLSRNGLAKDALKLNMRQFNPAYIPRNYLVEEALSAGADNNDFSFMEKLVEILRAPFELHAAAERYQQPPADGDRGYRTFCGT